MLLTADWWRLAWRYEWMADDRRPRVGSRLAPKAGPTARAPLPHDLGPDLRLSGLTAAQTADSPQTPPKHACVYVAHTKASKGQVWTRHFAPAASALTRPSSPSQFPACVTASNGPTGSMCCTLSSRAWARDMGFSVQGFSAGTCGRSKT